LHRKIRRIHGWMLRLIAYVSMQPSDYRFRPDAEDQVSNVRTELSGLGIWPVHLLQNLVELCDTYAEKALNAVGPYRCNSDQWERYGFRFVSGHLLNQALTIQSLLPVRQVPTVW